MRAPPRRSRPPARRSSAPRSRRPRSAAGGDQAIAKRVLPRVADYPSGWALDTIKPSDSGCFSAPAKAHGPTARAQASPDFIDPASQERSGANVWIFPSAEEGA